jgi:energy-coupling factor transporter ATP-binding protein EcfA2
VPRPGQVLGLVGTNGIGKSTALRILAGKDKPNLGNYDVCSAACPHQGRPRCSQGKVYVCVCMYLCGCVGVWVRRIRQTGTRSSPTSAAPSCKTTLPASSKRICVYAPALPDARVRARAVVSAWTEATGARACGQALIKPQYVDNISKVVKGNVGETLKGKTQRNNMNEMVAALGASRAPRLHTRLWACVGA